MAVNKKVPKDVIIIDDDKKVCDVLEMYCENLGCFRNIIVANDGSIASKKLTNQIFGLILLDVNMPRKTGIDILKEFKDSHPNNIENVILVSGELDKHVITAAMKQGCKQYLVKPFDEGAFAEKVRPVLIRNGIIDPPATT
ncbi:MAG: response regulator [Halobacteriovoraceae bacterium]|jgi:two-component system, chemotaxis family, chemotaxis protein CheY|nr:response regulator [Halobacteriovoraceae bacterium]MBT5095064.1 response regulator [Halobacteriovoraceae bacterium]